MKALLLLQSAPCGSEGTRSTPRGGHAPEFHVIALGDELAPEAIPGLSDAAHDFYTVEGAGKLRHRGSEHLARHQRKASRKSFDGEGKCFIETGGGKSRFGRGNFHAELVPKVKVHPPARRWETARVLFEKDWLRRWF